MDVFINRERSTITEEGRKRHMEFKVKPNDVIINTPPKCGTTWLQMVYNI